MRIARRFCGPPDTANGGYTAGLLARAIDGAVEVTLRRPPPLESELRIEAQQDSAQLMGGDALIAEARRTELDWQPPTAPSFERAVALSQHYVGHARHHFPTCFVCGPKRAVGDGLRIFPGAEEPGDPVVAPWVPGESLLGPDGAVRQEFLWAALDCIGYFAVAAPDYPIALLGRMSAQLHGTVNAAQRCVVVGLPLTRDGRKLHAGTALFDHDGRLLGAAKQTWISLSQ